MNCGAAWTGNILGRWCQRTAARAGRNPQPGVLNCARSRRLRRIVPARYILIHKLVVLTNSVSSLLWTDLKCMIVTGIV